MVPKILRKFVVANYVVPWKIANRMIKKIIFMSLVLWI